MNKGTKKLIAGTLFTIGCIHGINRLIDWMAQKKQLMRTSQGKYYTSSYGKIFYEVKGEGKPLLLIHDLEVGSSSVEWNQLMDLLSKKYCVYAVDLPGCGRSDKPELAYTAYYYIQLLQELIERVIMEQPIVIATGKSASIVTMAQSVKKDLFEQMILVSPENISDASYVHEKTFLNLTKIMKLPIIGTLLYNVSASRNLIEEAFEEQYFNKPNWLITKMTDYYYESAHLQTSGAKYLQASLQANYLYVDMKRALENLKIPCLVVCGEKDYSRVKAASSYKKICSFIECDIISDTKRLPQLEQPVTFCQTIVSFMEQE